MARNFTADDLFETPWVGKANANRLVPRYPTLVPDNRADVEAARQVHVEAEEDAPLPARTYLQPEQQLQCEIVRALRKVLKSRGGIVMAMNGELPGGRGGKEHRFMRAQMVRKAMGYVPGTPDLLLACPSMFYLRKWPYGLIEIKVPGGDRKIKVKDGKLVNGKTAPGRLSENQEMFRDWCLKCGLPWACVRSTDEALAAVKEWGWLDD